jgi:3-dehydroquinate dehydratase-2
MSEILVIHGPNLNLLGQREPHYYGHMTLENLNISLAARAEMHHQTIAFYQSNAEHELINRIHEAFKAQCPFIILNPASFTHTSIALRDAMLATQIPFIEVHLSNIYAREAFRRKSYFSDIAKGTIAGLGPQGYHAAFDAAVNYLEHCEKIHGYT